AAARCGAVGFQVGEVVDGAAAGRRRYGRRGRRRYLPAVDFVEYFFHVLVFVIPCQRAEAGVAWALRRARLHETTESDDKRIVAARVAGRLDRFLAPLQEALRVRERPLLL